MQYRREKQRTKFPCVQLILNKKGGQIIGRRPSSLHSTTLIHNLDLKKKIVTRRVWFSTLQSALSSLTVDPNDLNHFW